MCPEVLNKLFANRKKSQSLLEDKEHFTSLELFMKMPLQVKKQLREIFRTCKKYYVKR